MTRFTEDELEDIKTPRRLARERGEKTYFTGRPCPRGHVGPRYVGDMKCVGCSGELAQLRWKKRRETHADIDRDRHRRFREQNREKLRDYNRSVQSLPRRLASQKKWRETNKEYDRARHKAYHTADAELIRAKDNARNAADRDARRARDKANRDRNRDRYNATKRAWSRKNLDKVALKARKRRARRAGAEGWHTADDLARIRRLQGDSCAYCRIDLASAGHVDHIIALANGGSNWPRNLQLVCRPCNSSKRIEDPIAFAQRKGRLL